MAIDPFSEETLSFAQAAPPPPNAQRAPGESSHALALGIVRAARRQAGDDESRRDDLHQR
jgi:hypothetical protein